MNKKPIENCVVCGNSIYRGGEKNKPKIEKRKIQSICCSRRCGKYYRNVSYYLKSRLKTKMKNGNKI